MKSLLPDWWPSDKPYKIIDCYEGLKLLPDNVLDCVVTSPPYWGLRDYGTGGKIWGGKPRCKHEWGKPVKAPTKNATQGSTETKKHPNMQKTQTNPSPGKFCNKCNAWYGELGLEPTPDMFVNHLCDIFDEVRRSMKPTGTCWVNLGDTYNGANAGEIPAKSLVMIPSRFAIEMVNRGWILRNTIIWHKPSCLPSSATDRFTVDFEYIYFFTKNKKYYFEQQIEKSQSKEPTATGSKQIDTRLTHGLGGGNDGLNKAKQKARTEGGFAGRNKRAVWSINPRPFSGAHFACYPPELVETPIKAGCPEQVCKKCGTPREKIYKTIETADVDADEYDSKYDNDVGQTLQAYHRGKTIANDRAGSKEMAKELFPDNKKKQQEYVNWVHDHNMGKQKEFFGWSDCGCGKGWTRGIVLDPFLGSGTTIEVARNLDRLGLGFDIQPDYENLIKERSKSEIPRLEQFE